ncbi:tape measure protein [Labrys portucalensis]|uniref:Tape measure protein n=1 Tax=Labrys neptuniae TaxID=376174 RepID=A0ABV6Z8L8_9HYPH
MPTDVERLIVTLEASTKKYENALAKAKSQTDRQASAIDQRFKKLSQQIDSSMDRGNKSMARGFDASGMSRSFSGLAQSLRSTTGLVGIITAAVAAAGAGVVNYGDRWNAIGNRLKTAGIAVRNIGDEQSRVTSVALKAHSELEATSDLYVKMLGVSQSLGQANSSAADATQAVAQALSLAGVSADAAKGTITQLGQALGSGVLRGDEFNSIMESLGTQSPLIRSIAREFGVSANELRGLAAAGQLTSDRVFKAIVAAKPEIEALADGTVPTLSQAWTDLDTATTKWVATMVGGEEAANSVAAAMADLAKKIDGVSQAYEDAQKRRQAFDDEATLKAPQLIRDNIAEIEKQIQAEQAAGASDYYLDNLRLALQSEKDRLKEAEKVAGVKKEELATVQKITDLQQELLREAARTRGTSGHADPVQDMLDKRSRDAGLSSKEAEIAKATDDIVEAMKKAGTKLTGFALQDAARAQAEREYSLRAGVQATEAIVKSYVDRVVKAESGGDPRAKNPNSTATGVGQFIESTWIALFRKYYPQQAESMGRDAILDLRKDGNISRDLIEKYAAENAAVLQKAGVSVNEAALQLSHFLGAGDAAKVLKAAPGTPLQGLISQKSINANPSILGGGRTVDDAIAYARRRANDTRVAAGDLTADERRKQTLDEIIKKNQQDIDGLKLKGAALTQTAYQTEYLAKRQELLNEATQSGIALTPQVVASLEAEARKYAESAVAREAAQKKFDEMIDAQREFANLAVDGLTGLIDGSKDLKGALEDVLKSLIRLVLQAALLGEGPLAGLFGGSSKSGGLLGGLFGGLLGGFSGGGYTGSGGKYQPAGIVHRDEYVFDQQATKRIGVANLERLRRGLPGFANGGFVGAGLPTSFKVSAVGATSAPGLVLNMPMSFDARGASADAIPALRREMQVMRQQIRQEVPSLVLNARKRGSL